ncbi:MAG: DUF3394 domain-containing protein, partial [Pseudomonadota bacterium]
DFWMDQLIPPYQQISPQVLTQHIQPTDESIRLLVEGYSLEGDLVQKTVLLPLTEQSSPDERLAATGLSLTYTQDDVRIDFVDYGSPAAKAGLDFDWRILALEQPNPRPPLVLWYLPALALLALIGWNQIRRRMAG